MGFSPSRCRFSISPRAADDALLASTIRARELASEQAALRPLAHARRAEQHEHERVLGLEAAGHGEVSLSEGPGGKAGTLAANQADVAQA